MEYVSERASLYELSKSVKAWERKTEIAEVCAYSRLDNVFVCVSLRCPSSFSDGTAHLQADLEKAVSANTQVHGACSQTTGPNAPLLASRQRQADRHGTQRQWHSNDYHYTGLTHNMI